MIFSIKSLVQGAGCVLLALGMIPSCGCSQVGLSPPGTNNTEGIYEWKTFAVYSCARQEDLEDRQLAAELVGKQLLLMSSGIPFDFESGILHLKVTSDLKDVKATEVLADDDHLVLQVQGKVRAQPRRQGGEHKPLTITRSHTTNLIDVVRSITTEVESILREDFRKSNTVKPGTTSGEGSPIRVMQQPLSGFLLLKRLSLVNGKCPPECRYTIEVTQD